MKIKTIVNIVNLGLLLAFISPAVAIDRILDEKSVDVPLPVGKEIIVKFPMAVSQTELLDGERDGLRQFLRPDGVLMLKASEAFGEARMIASMLDGNVVVLDLNAQVGAINYETINLVEPKSLKKKQMPTINGVPMQEEKPVQRSAQSKTIVVQNDAQNTGNSEQNPNKPAFLKPGAAMTKNAKKTTSADANVGFNEMVQYGFRHFVGPSRLIGKQSAKRVRVSRSGVSRLVRMWGNSLSIKPLGQWKIGNQYVTVLLVNNTSSSPVAFDPRALRGRLMFAAALYPVIQPQGSVQDQTLWSVVTAVPFNKAIR